MGDAIESGADSGGESLVAANKARRRRLAQIARVESLDSESGWSESEVELTSGEPEADGGDDRDNQDNDGDGGDEDGGRPVMVQDLSLPASVGSLRGDDTETKADVEETVKETAPVEVVTSTAAVSSPVDKPSVEPDTPTPDAVPEIPEKEQASSSPAASTSSPEAPSVPAPTVLAPTVPAPSTPIRTGTRSSSSGPTDPFTPVASKLDMVDKTRPMLAKTPQIQHGGIGSDAFAEYMTPGTKKTIMGNLPMRTIADESPPIAPLDTESPPSFLVDHDEPDMPSSSNPPKFALDESNSSAAATSSDVDRTAIHIDSDKSSDSIEILSDFQSTLPASSAAAAPAVIVIDSDDVEAEVEEDADPIRVAAAATITAAAASPNRRRREVETDELYESAAKVIQSTKGSSTLRPDAYVKSPLMSDMYSQLRSGSVSSASADGNDFDAVTALADTGRSRSRRGRNRLGRTTGSLLRPEHLRSGTDEEKLAALLLQPSSLESLKKIVPAPETNIASLSIVLAGEMPDDTARQQVKRSFARALHSVQSPSTDFGAGGVLAAYDDAERYGLHIEDVTGDSDASRRRAAIGKADLCVYFLGRPVSEQQLDGAAECAEQICILPVCLTKGDGLFEDQRLITRGLTHRKVANTVLTPGSTSTMAQLTEMHPSTLAFSLQLAQERTVKERTDIARNRVRLACTAFFMLFLGLLLLVVLPADGSRGRDALDAALPAEWSAWLASWSPLPSRDIIFGIERQLDYDPHADWIHGHDTSEIDDGAEWITYEPLPELSSQASTSQGSFDEHSEQNATYDSKTEESTKDDKSDDNDDDDSEYIPDDVFAWLYSLPRRFTLYLKEESAPVETQQRSRTGKKGQKQPLSDFIRLAKRRLATWIETVFGTFDEDEDGEPRDGGASQSQNDDQQQQQQQQQQRRRRRRRRRTSYRVYKEDISGQMRWAVDTMLDSFDDGRIFMARATAPLRHEIELAFTQLQKTQFWNTLMRVRAILRDALAEIILATRGHGGQA
ncbi:hypothetical protein THASP1DRAFT_29859 [Thamnocephalis sphaerospora]|uniref:Uncharacterized protein n=1 Tax=Thamnocephalis sphaerospora TaxID=78915 RepID=A0A4P9XQK6_9FUNG|nr:hypothetical protein THASP1DRAFT_29859 [Thamnocephalis sphaerospora]|eukprot:RKP08326.1 hypothetical protein THASP1DRAFT_29859 [Thamnocephalis sphaerospora]